MATKTRTKATKGKSVSRRTAKPPAHKGKATTTKAPKGASAPKVRSAGGPHVTPFLMFPQGCAEAVKLYTSTFKDGRIHHLGSMGKGPDGTELVNAEFEVGGQRLNAMDGGPSFSFAQGFSLFVGCDTQQEIDHFWTAFTKDGGAPGPCGWLTDKWGISWQIVPSNLGKMLSDRKSGNTGAAMQAMLQMKKLDIKTLEKAYRS